MAAMGRQLANPTSATLKTVTVNSQRIGVTSPIPSCVMRFARGPSRLPSVTIGTKCWWTAPGSSQRRRSGHSEIAA